MVEGLERHRQSQLDVATALAIVFGQKRERLAVERDGALLRPAATGVVSSGDEVVNRTGGLAGLAPVVAKGLVRLADAACRLREKPRDGRMPFATGSAWESLVGDVADQAVLERELLIALDAGDRLAADEVALFE